MEPKLQLCVFMLLIQISLAVGQHITVIKGQTLTLSCPMNNAHMNHADWKNSDGFLMFFNGKSVLKDKRYSIIKLSQSEFTISVSNITFKDGGIYTCSHYNHAMTETTVKVTVLGIPRMTVTKHNGETVIKCTSEGNYPQKISWQLDNGPEFYASSQQYYQEDKKYVSVDQLYFHSAGKRVTVKCLVHHPGLQPNLQRLMDFVKIGQNKAKTWLTSTIGSSPTTHSLGSTHDRTTVYSKKDGPSTDSSAMLSTAVPSMNSHVSTSDVDGPSTDSSAKLSTAAPAETKMFTSTVNYVPSINTHVSTSEPFVLSGQTTKMNDTINNETSTDGWTFVYEMTRENTPENSTGENLTDLNNKDIKDKRIETRGNSSLLVFLVTCLIVCLLVVVIFFAVKLRRAHVIWKRENEESDPSEESSKSKSSQEDKNAQTQRRKGLFNTAFTQYVIEEPTTVTSVVNAGVMAATTVINNGHTSQAQTLSQAADKAEIKETEL